VTAARAIVAALLLLVARQPAIAEDSVFGRWATPGVSAIVQLAQCGDATRLCGTIRWLWDGVDEKGRPRLDTRNVDSGLRSRPLLGLAILSDVTIAKPGVWEGRIYNPEDGQSYRATLSRRSADTLVVEGCVLFVCQKQIWRKASALAEALK
jgi:Delta7-sterol 5-desaturase